MYRPKGLATYDDNGWLMELQVRKSGNQLILENPTAYHIIIYAFSNTENGQLIEKDIILKPFSQETVSVNIGNTPYIYFINDYGAGQALSYLCQGATCSLKP